MRVFGSLLAVLVVGCVLEPLEPASAALEVRLFGLAELELDRPVRYAVVWTMRHGYHVSADGPVGAAGGPVTTFEVELALPAADVIAELSPMEGIGLAPAAEAVDAFRPRILVYEDFNDDQRFGSRASGIPAPDRILALDGGEVVAILDLEAALGTLNLEEIGYFYGQTGDRFISFFNFLSEQSYFDQPAVSGLESLVLRTDDRLITTLDFECGRLIDIDLSTRNSVDEQIVLVDETIDPVSICGLLFPRCSGVDLDKAWPPPLLEPIASGWPTRELQCIRGELLEVLHIRDKEPTCAGCECWARITDTTYVVDPRAPPAWWPCGDTIEYCEYDVPLYYFSGLCSL